MTFFCISTIILKASIILVNKQSVPIGIIKYSGLITSLLVLINCIIALPCIKTLCFPTLYFFYKSLGFLILFFSVMHNFTTIYYIIPSVLFYIIDLSIKWSKTRESIYVNVKNIGELDKNNSCIFINISLLNPINIDAGSYFFIRRNYKWYRISCISRYGSNLLFCIKNKRNLWNLNNEETNMETKITYIQGPYKYLNIDYKQNQYEYVVAIATETGITPILSIIKDMNDNETLDKLKKVFVIWIINHPALVLSYNYMFTALKKYLFNFQIINTNKDNILLENINTGLIHDENPNIDYLVNSIIDDNLVLKHNTLAMYFGSLEISQKAIKTFSKLNIPIHTKISNDF
jgi:NAD(P)H-flavin reductase